MNKHYSKFVDRINTLENLRHYIDMEFSWLNAMIWGIVGLSLIPYIGWWALFTVLPIYKNIKISIILFSEINRSLEKKECDFREEVNK